MRKALPYFGQLWCDDKLAISFLGITCVIVIMVSLCRPHFFCRRQLRHYRLFCGKLAIQPFNTRFCLLFLLLRLPENCRAVLNTDIFALAIHRGWIMAGKKHQQQIIIRNLIWVEAYRNHFDMPCGACAYLCVSRGFDRTSAITWLYREHATQLPERRFCTPKAAPAKDGKLAFQRRLCVLVHDISS